MSIENGKKIEEGGEIKKEKSKLENIREKFRIMKAESLAAQEAGRKDYNPHFEFIDPALISEEDVRLLEEVDAIETMDDYERVAAEIREIPASKDKRIDCMRMYIANLVNGKLAEILGSKDDEQK